MKNKTASQVFSKEFYKKFKNTYFEEHLWETAFIISILLSDKCRTK